MQQIFRSIPVSHAIKTLADETSFGNSLSASPSGIVSNTWSTLTLAVMMLAPQPALAIGVRGLNPLRSGVAQ